MKKFTLTIVLALMCVLNINAQKEDNENGVIYYSFFDGKPSDPYIQEDGTPEPGSFTKWVSKDGVLTVTGYFWNDSTDVNNYMIFDAMPSMMTFDTTEDYTFQGMNLYGLAWNGDMYNLQGQRLSRPTKGICVRNGKKFVVK